MQQKISFSSGCYITSHLQVKIMLFCSFFFHLFSCLNREIHKTTKEHSLGPQVFHICTVINFMILILEEICVNWSKHLVKKTLRNTSYVRRKDYKKTKLWWSDPKQTRQHNVECSAPSAVLQTQEHLKLRQINSLLSVSISSQELLP